MALDLDTALRGISGILVTPYDDAGDVAPHKLIPIIDRALAALPDNVIVIQHQ